MAPGDVPSKMSGIMPMRREYSTRFQERVASTLQPAKHRDRAARAATGDLGAIQARLGPALADGLHQEVHLLG